MTSGVGNHQMMSAQFIDWTLPNRFHSSGSLGVMGVGLPYAIGCQIGNMNKRVIDIDGDGSFLMTMSDMKTIVEHNLPVKILIMNNNSQDMVRVWEELFFENRITATQNKMNPEFSQVAEAFGIKGLLCEGQDDLSEKIKLFLEYDGPVLLECKVEKDYCLPLVQTGAGLDEMILHGDIIRVNEKAECPS
jgi:acetolactate synthase-1/2/3 large subunit